MARPDFDPRTGGSCIKCIANKFVSYVVGYFQLIMWVIAFFTLVFSPSSVSSVVQSADTKTTVIAGFLALFCVVFSVVLLIGLHKDRRLYVKAYCLYAVVYLVLIVVSIIINIFIQPEKLGFRGFFSMIFSFFLNLFFLFVVRSYYLITYCNGSDQQRIHNEPKV